MINKIISYFGFIFPQWLTKLRIKNVTWQHVIIMLEKTEHATNNNNENNNIHHYSLLTDYKVQLLIEYWPFYPRLVLVQQQC